jgi:hypothetical protein
VLIPAQRQKSVLMWTAVSAVVGVLLMVAAGLAANVAGIALGMAVSEALLFLGLLRPSLRILPAGARGRGRKVGSAA